MQLAHPGGLGFGQGKIGAGAGQVPAKADGVWGVNQGQSLPAPHRLPFDHQQAGDQTGIGHGDGNAAFGGKLHLPGYGAQGQVGGLRSRFGTDPEPRHLCRIDLACLGCGFDQFRRFRLRP